jgi:ribose transport system ATP-binding protein
MRGIQKRFGATVALAGVDIEVQAGEVVALVGENGAGKSTLMKVLSGAHPADAGEMWLDGAPYQPRGASDARSCGIAMIYQELSLAPHLTVAENIVLGMEPCRWGLLQRDVVRGRAEAALAKLGHSEINPDVRIDKLPLASRQLVEIARALAVGSRVIVLDEPTSSLSSGDIQGLFSVVRSLKAQGHALIYISHFLEEVKEISDRFVVLRDGRSVGQGRTDAVSTDEIVTMMVGRKVTELYPRSERTQGDPILTISSLSGIEKPTGASLTLHRGEVCGIAGLVGAGRTELIRALFGLDPVRSGDVRIGAYSGPASPASRWRQGVGMVSEDRKLEGLATSLTIADNVTLPKLSGLGPWGLVLRKNQRAMADSWLGPLQIKSEDSLQRVASLSGGNQQKVALARLLHADVDVFLLDEPTRGIDVGSKAEIYRRIDELASRGKAILMVSSYLPELLGICDRIAVMCRGHLHATHSVRDVDERTIMVEATGAQ